LSVPSVTNPCMTSREDKISSYHKFSNNMKSATILTF